MAYPRRTLTAQQFRSFIEDCDRDEHNESQRFLDLETLDVVHNMIGFDDDEGLMEEIEAEPERFVELPFPELDAYGMMRGFAESLDDRDAAKELADAIVGKGAFARFRQRLRDLDLVAQFHDARTRAMADEVRVWLAGHGIDAPELAPLASPVVPARTPKATDVSLTEFLLLAVPDGRTEVLGGRVRRAATFATPDLARGVFRSVARSICDALGIPWRKRFVEGTSVFEREPFHLSHRDANVELLVDVSVGAVKLLTERPPAG